MNCNFPLNLARTIVAMLVVSFWFIPFATQINAQSPGVAESLTQVPLVEAPKVVFRVSAFIQNSDLWGDPVVANLPRTVGGNF